MMQDQEWKHVSTLLFTVVLASLGCQGGGDNDNDDRSDSGGIVVEFDDSGRIAYDADNTESRRRDGSGAFVDDVLVDCLFLVDGEVGVTRQVFDNGRVDIIVRISEEGLVNLDSTAPSGSLRFRTTLDDRPREENSELVWGRTRTSDDNTGTNVSFPGVEGEFHLSVVVFDSTEEDRVFDGFSSERALGCADGGNLFIQSASNP